MGVKEIRELLRLYNLEHSVVQNKNSGRYSIILHNNIIGTNVDGEKVVVFRTFRMEAIRSLWSEIDSMRGL